MNRWPTLILVATMIATLFAAESQRSSQQETAAPVAVQQGLGPATAPADASGSTWYCPAGFTTPDGANDHVIVLTNPTDERAVGTLTLYPSLLDVDGNTLPFPRAVQPIEVPAGAQIEIALAELVTRLDPQLASNFGAFVGALAEFDGAGISVEHSVVAAQGIDVGPCATSAATSWWFSSGTTTAGVGYQMYLLNPFPDDAVVNVSFVTDAGSRSPTAFKARLIPAQSLTVLQVSPEVAVNAQVTAQITVVAGRVIAERIQKFENENGPAGISMSLGSNRLAEQWFFPAGRSVRGAGESYVIYNPGDLPAEVEFEAKPDSADRVGDVAPLVIPVGGRERWIVTLASHPAHPVDALATIDATTMVESGDPYFVSIRSFNGQPIVAERVLTRPLPTSGVTASLGVDVASTDQTLAISAVVEQADEATLAVLNPAGDTISRVSVFVGGPEGEELRAEAELAPRRRGVFDLANLVEPGDRWIRVRSSSGTMAELTASIPERQVTSVEGLTTVSNPVVLSTQAIPVQGTTSVPDLLAFD